MTRGAEKAERDGVQIFIGIGVLDLLEYVDAAVGESDVEDHVGAAGRRE